MFFSLRLTLYTKMPTSATNTHSVISCTFRNTCRVIDIHYSCVTILVLLALFADYCHFANKTSVSVYLFASLHGNMQNNRHFQKITAIQAMYCYKLSNKKLRALKQ